MFPNGADQGGQRRTRYRRSPQVHAAAEACIRGRFHEGDNVVDVDIVTCPPTTVATRMYFFVLALDDLEPFVDARLAEYVATFQSGMKLAG